VFDASRRVSSSSDGSFHSPYCPTDPEFRHPSIAEEADDEDVPGEDEYSAAEDADDEGDEHDEDDEDSVSEDTDDEDDVTMVAENNP